MQRLMMPTAASSSSWQNPNNALVLDGQFSKLLANASNGYLSLSALTDRFIDGDISIVGIEVQIEAGYPPAFETLEPIDPQIEDTFQRLEVSLTLNGGTPLGNPIYCFFTGSVMTLGSNITLWGRTWTKAEIQNAGFGVLIRRGDVLGDEATSTLRRVNATSVTVHFNYAGGSLMPGIARPRGSQRFVFAPEVTPGTPVAPTTMLKHSRIDFASAPEYKDIETYGSMLPEGRVLQYEISAGDLQVTSVDYNELAFWLASRFGKPVSTLLTTGVYSHEYTIDPRKLRPIWTMNTQRGDFNIAEENSFALLKSLGLDFSGFTSVNMTGSAVARPDINKRNGGNTDSIGLQGGVACVQTIAAPTGSPTGGTVSYRFKGAVASWSYNANAAAVTSALVALSTIGAGGVTVTGSGPWVVTFAAGLAGKEQPLIELDSSALTGGTSPLPGGVTMTTKGGWTEYETAPLVAGTGSMFVGDTIAALPSSQISDLKNFGFSADDSLQPDDTFGSAVGLTFDRIIEKPAQLKMMFGVERNSSAYAWLTKSRDNSKIYARIAATSSQLVAVGYPYSLTIDTYGQLKDMGTVEAMGEIVGRKFEVQSQYSTSWGRGAKITLVCAVPGSAL